MDSILELKQSLLLVAKKCSDRGMQTGNGGNLSARIPGQELMLIKASEVSFSHMTLDDFVICDFEGNLVEGGGKPSKESRLHGAIYKKLSRVGSIVHCHSPWATGWASTMEALPFSTYHSQIKLKGKVEVFDTKSYAVPPEFFPHILNMFDRQPEAMAFLLKGHGLVALGRNITEAANNADLVEETAHIAVLERLLCK